MSSYTDHELIEQVLAGQVAALGDLFDRYSTRLYDFLLCVVGDPEKAGLLLTDVFTRFPSFAEDTPETESISGGLFSLARERAFYFLDQHGWLDSLPASSSLVASFSDLVNDIWNAARGMPAAQRATLAIEERQALSPMEKAIALGVLRAALPSLVADARRTFNEQFDIIAQAEGKPLAQQTNPDLIPGLQRLVPDPDASLFTFMPVLAMTDSVRARLRDQIMAAAQAQVTIVPAPSEPGQVQVIPVSPIFEEEPVYTAPNTLLPVLAVGLVLALCAALLVAGLTLTRRAQPASANTGPIVKQVIPEDGAILPPSPNVIVQAIYSDDRGIDPNTVQLIIDGRDVTLESTVSSSSVSYNRLVAPGPHVVVLTLKNTQGTPTTISWRFTLSAAPPATLTLIPSPTLTPIPTFTPLPSITPQPTATPFPTATPQPTATFAPTFTPVPTFTPPPTATPVPTAVLPDLVVTDISLNPNAQIVYIIRNSGPGDVAQPFLIQVFVDTTVVDASRRVNSLPTGHELTLTVPNYTMVGTHTLTVLLNPNQEVRESNYSNNQLVRTLAGPVPTATPTTSTP